MGEAALETGDGALLRETLGWMLERAWYMEWIELGEGPWGDLFMRTYKGILMAQHPRGVHETARDYGAHGHLF